MKRLLVLLLLSACSEAAQPTLDADAGASAAVASASLDAAPLDAGEVGSPDATAADATAADAIAADAIAADAIAADATAADATAADAGAPPDGVRLVRDGCDGPLGALPGTSCQTLEVRCGGLDPIEVALRVTPPTAGVAARGVVVFGSGGAGTGLWSGPPSTRRMMTRLLGQGFTLVERQWLNEREAGWFQDLGGRGVPAAACRYATLLRHIDATLRTGDQPLCATGNSGGSAELGVAITRTDAADLLDLAIPSSGPFHRMDLACDGSNDAAWQAECDALKARHCPTCAARSCSLGNGPKRLMDGAYGSRTPCTGSSTPVEPAVLRADSPIAPGARTLLPQTKVALLIGEQDEGPYAPMSAALYEALLAAGTEVTFATEPLTGHEFQSTDEGASRIEGVLLADCVRRH